jgi:uncharacterized membrane protein YgcG
MSFLVGVTGSPRRSEWWDLVLSLAYNIQNIPEIRSHTWRSIIPGANNAERRSAWNNDLNVSATREVLYALQAQVLEVAEIYGIDLVIVESTLYDVEGMPFNTVEQARQNMLLLVDESARIAEGAAEGERRVGGRIQTGVPTPPPCNDEDNLEVLNGIYDQDRCIPGANAASSMMDWTTQTVPYLNSQTCEYYITINTDVECPAGDQLPARVQTYGAQAVDKLCQLLQKSYTVEDVRIVIGYVLDKNAYEFNKPPNNNLQLLYKVPFALFKALRLPDLYPAVLTDLDTADSRVSFDMRTLFENIDKFGRSLTVFGQDQAIAFREQQTRFLLDGTSLEINLPEEAQTIQLLKKSIVDMLEANGFVLPIDGNISTSTVSFPQENRVADTVTILFDSQYSLINAFAEERGSDSVALSLQKLSPNQGILNPTLLYYLINLKPILRQINTTNRIDVARFVQLFHYPSVTIEYPSLEAQGSLQRPAGEIGREVTNSILEELISAGDYFASKFASNVCASKDEKLLTPEALFRQQAGELQGILEEANKEVFGTFASMAQDAAQVARNIAVDAIAIRLAWERLFDNMTACGLAKVVMQTMKFITENDVCGLNPQDALKAAISSLLKGVDISFLKDIYDALPSSVRSLIRDVYFGAITPIVDATGYNFGNQFPWEYEEVVGSRRRQEDAGVTFYSSTLFNTPTREQRVAAQQQSFEAGYRADFNETTNSLTEDAFWSGYVDSLRSGPSPESEVVYEPPPDSIIMPVGEQINELVGEFSTELITLFVQTIVEELQFEQLLEAVKDIPVIGVLLQNLPQVAGCVVNPNLTKNGETISLSELPFNLFQGGEFDICDVIPPEPITMPDLELVMKQKINTIWPAFINALIDALGTLLKSLLVKSLANIVKLASEVSMGALCDAIRGGIADAIESSLPVQTPTSADLRGLFRDAITEAGGPGADTDSQLQLAFSALGGLSFEDAAAAISGENNLIDLLSRRLRMDQLINLLEGSASDAVLDVVLEIITSNYSDLSSAINSRSSVRSFFMTMGRLFPASFLQESRASLGVFGGDQELIVSLCGIDTNEALSNIEDRLREECGQFISDEQIEQQIQSFRARAERALDELSKGMSQGGLSTSLTETFTDTIRSTVPKDEPGNLSIAEDIIASMLNPMYSFYARDLMKPIQPNSNAGALNMILANKNGVPQQGQINNFKAASTFLSLPFNLPGTATGPIADAIEEGIEQIFFGDSPASLKPQTVGKKLQNSLLDLDGDVAGNNIVLRFINPDLPPTDGFVIDYNLTNGLFSLIYPVPFDPTAVVLPNPELRNMIFTNQFQSVIDGLLSDGALVGDIQDTYGAPLEATPNNLGAGSFLLNFNSTGLVPPSLSPEERSTTNLLLFVDSVELMRIIRDPILKRIADSVANNSNAFEYGNYNLEELNESVFLDGLPPPSGYTVQQLTNGQFVVTPPAKGGWLGIKDSLLPEDVDEFCCPPKKELFDIQSIIDRTLESFKNSEEDPRLSLNPKTVKEPPYSKILNRMSLASIEGTIVATIRTYIVEFFIKGAAPLTKFKTTIPETYSGLLISFIAEKIKNGLRGSGPFPGAPTYPPVVPPIPIPGNPDGNLLFAYWYEFLEQCAQVVSRRVKDGIIQPNPELDTAMRNIQILIDNYEYPQRPNLAVERLLIPDPVAALSVTMKKLRQKNKIEAIRQSEDDAMVILKYLIADEFERVANDIEEIFPEPSGGWIENLYTYFIQEITYGADSIRIFDVPTIGGRLDSSAGSLMVSGDFAENGQFVLQSYIKGTRRPSRAADIPDWIDGSTYNTREALQIIFDSIPGMISVSDEDVLVPYFESFRYGLRLVYVPSPEELTSIDSLRTKMSELYGSGDRDVMNRLYSHPGLASGGVGAYSIPIVVSDELEQDILPLNGSQLLEINERSHWSTSTGWSISESSPLNFNALIRRMLTNDQFLLMFGYAVPMTEMLSMLTIYSSEAFLSSVGKEDSWILRKRALPSAPLPRVYLQPPGAPGPLLPPPNNYYRWSKKFFPQLRRKLKRLFRDLYNSNDFTFQAERRNARSREDVDRIRRDSTVADTTAGLSPDVLNNIIVIEGGLCTDLESDTTSTGGAGGTAGGSSSSGGGGTADTSGGASSSDPVGTGPLPGGPITESDPSTLPTAGGGGGPSYGPGESPYVCMNYYFTSGTPGLSGRFYEFILREEAERFVSEVDSGLRASYSDVSFVDAPSIRGPFGPTRDNICDE